MDTRNNTSCPEDTTPSAMILREVGIIRNKVDQPFLRAGEDGITMEGDLDVIKEIVRKTYGAESRIVIDETLTGIFDGLEGYSHLIVLYWAHHVPESSRLLTRVHPMGRQENPLVGIFGTCSPARPNPVLMTVVRLHEKKGNVLTVSGLDAIDGSPVIDIKPYVNTFYPQQDIRIPSWMQTLLDDMKDIEG